MHHIKCSQQTPREAALYAVVLERRGGWFTPPAKDIKAVVIFVALAIFSEGFQEGTTSFQPSLQTPPHFITVVNPACLI